LTQHLSVLSVIIGLTAWHGVNKVLNPASGDVLVVSAGAGAVGSLVGQLAKIKGAKVIGIAGSEAKCKFMKDEVCVGVCESIRGIDLLFAVWLRLCHQLQNR
jgi:NADPH-dependent curcumin reductase CurA